MRLIKPPEATDPVLESYRASLEEYAALGQYQKIPREFSLSQYLELFTAQEAKWARHLVKDLLWFVDDGTFLGHFTFIPAQDGRSRAYNGDIGYDLRPTARGKGLGKEILRLGLEWVRANYQADIVMLAADRANTASCKIIERLGGTVLATQPGPPERHLYGIKL